MCPAGKSLGAAISHAFSPLVNTNVLHESMDDLNENPATSNEVHLLSSQCCGPRAVSGVCEVGARFGGQCAER